MKKEKQKNKKILYTLIAVVFWLIIWQAASMGVGRDIFLPTPYDVFEAFTGLLGKSEFWLSILFSFVRIVSGFLLALIAGVLLAAGSYWVSFIGIVISPVMKLIKAVPVASFIILVLMWVDSDTLPLIISFLMVLPVIYINVLAGIESTDKKLLEMAEVFSISTGRKIRYIFLPAMMPHFISAVSIGLGFCWKSGIAAEVIGLSPHSIGRQLYDAKLYVMTKELFAWTAVIIIISVVFEKLVMKLLSQLNGQKRIS